MGDSQTPVWTIRTCLKLDGETYGQKVPVELWKDLFFSPLPKLAEEKTEREPAD